MDDLQNQTQELLNKFLMGQLVKHDEVKGLLRRIVEETLEEIEFWRNCGNPMDSPKMPEWIRSHFDWLMEGE